MMKVIIGKLNAENSLSWIRCDKNICQRANALDLMKSQLEWEMDGKSISGGNPAPGFNSLGFFRPKKRDLLPSLHNHFGSKHNFAENFLRS